MKHNIISALLLILLGTTSTVAQEQESILSAPDNWLSEQFTFPISFAPSIDYQGFEDLRFPPEWSDTSSHLLWTYTFVWFVEKQPALTEAKLTNLLEVYFDGLMGVDRDDSTNPSGPQKTIGKFARTEEGFRGTVRVHDAFFHKRPMTLNVLVLEKYCKEVNKDLISFQLSPSPFDSEVWAVFDAVKLKIDCQ